MENVHIITYFFLWVNPSKILYIKHQLISEIHDAWTSLSLALRSELDCKLVAEF